jgi:hypothetical protein
MSSSQQSTQSQTISAPWTVQQPYLEQAFGGAAGALSSANANAGSSTYGAPTQFVAGATPDQLQTFNSMVNYGLNNGVSGAQTSAGNGAVATGQGATDTALNNMNGFNPAAVNNINSDINAGNSYASGANIPAQVQAAMMAANQEANQVTLPGIDRAAAGSGNVNSSRTGIADGLVQQGLAEQAGSLASQLEANYYNTGAGLQANASAANNSATLANNQQEAQLGGSNESMGLGALTSAMNNASTGYGIASQGGLGQQEANQATNANQLQAYNFGQNSPFQALQNFYNIIGSGQWGGVSNTNSNTTYTPSMLQTIGGIMGAVNSLGGGGGGMSSGMALY